MNLENMKRQIKIAMDKEKERKYQEIVDKVIKLIQDYGYDEVLRRLEKQ